MAGLPTLGQDLDHRYTGSVIGFKEANIIRPVKVMYVEDTMSGGCLFHLAKQRVNGNYFDTKTLTTIMLNNPSPLVFDIPKMGYFNAYRETPYFAAFFERLPTKQFKRGITAHSHAIEHIDSSLFNQLDKLIPMLTVDKPKVLYYIYNRRFLPYRIAYNMIQEGKAISVALSRRIAINIYPPMDVPVISYLGIQVGFAKPTKIILIGSGKECAQDIEEITGVEVTQ